MIVKYLMQDVDAAIIKIDRIANRMGKSMPHWIKMEVEELQRKIHSIHAEVSHAYGWEMKQERD